MLWTYITDVECIFLAGGGGAHRRRHSSLYVPAMLITACNPEEHCLLTHDSGTVSGMPLKQDTKGTLL